MERLLKGTTAYKILTGDRQAGRLSHAYMLDFPDRKNMSAALKIFALGFFGAEDGCPLYNRILSGSYPDCKFYPKDGEKLTADAIGELLEDSVMRPVEGSKKLFVIVGFENASQLLQNKLLKTLEEPCEGIHFLLGAATLAPVLDTVKSRVKTLTIPPFTDKEVFDALERVRSDDLNSAAAESAGGILGAAQNMVEGGWFEEVSSAAKELCATVRVGDIGVAAAKYGDTNYKTEILTEMQRLYFSALKEGGKLADVLQPAALVFALEELNGAFADLKFNANFQGLLYDFLLKVAKENSKWQRLLR